MPVIVCLPIHAKLAIVIGEKVSPGAEVELLEHSFHPANILPHHVFAPDLERLREVVELLILRSLFEMLWLRLASPLYVPFRAIRTDNTHSSCL